MMDPEHGSSWSPMSDDDDENRRMQPLDIEKPRELKGTAQLLPESGGSDGIAAFPPVADGPRYQYAAIDEEAARAARSRRRWKALILGIIVSLASIIVLSIIVPVVIKRHNRSSASSPGTDDATTGTPDISSPPSVSDAVANQRTAFHFQPMKNWMNDPNGPMFYKGQYHLFYQYNPGGAVWGNISWGHAVSNDLIHWSYLPPALEPDQWYDAQGIWSGSATILADGTPVLLYTGYNNASEQVQNMAVPVDPSDQYLRQWQKSPSNPIARAPLDVSPRDFRDPTTAWKGPDGAWRMLVGARINATGSNIGLAQVYRSENFSVWTRNAEPLHSLPGTGMWEMPDFFPVSVSNNMGVDASYNASVAVKHVLKVSVEKLGDFYTVGDYDATTDTWDPIDSSLDIGKGLKYDYGKYYASKTFYDSEKKRRVLMSWVAESDLAADDVAKGWASVQAIPRTLWLDEKFGSQLRQLPVEEVTSLRTAKDEKTNLQLPARAFVSMDGSSGNQLDIEASFAIPSLPSAVEEAAASFGHANPDYSKNCNALGIAGGGVVGPFGVGVLVGGELQEITAVYFEMVPAIEPSVWRTRVCSDHTRSSLAAGVEKGVYGGEVQVASYEENQLSLRILVDHSIVEVFAQNGRTCITSRVYPQLSLGKEAKVVLFNNGTVPVVVNTITVWQMSGITMNPL